MAPISENARGALFMSVSMAAFVCNDALMKVALGEVPLFQAILLRGVVVTALLTMFAAHRGVLRTRIAPGDRKLIGLRVVGEMGGTLCFLTALAHMPLANVTAILQSLPLAVTLAAALFLGEEVGWRRYTAIAIGFVGVLIIVRPGSEGFTVYSIWALVSVGFVMLRDLSTRRLSRQVPSTLVALASAVGSTLLGAVVSAAGAWEPVSGGDLRVLGGAAVFLFAGYLFNVMSMRHGEIGFVSPFRYTVLIWALVLGLVVFGDVPRPTTLLGSAIVVVTGVYTFYRERIRAREARRAEAASAKA